MRAIATPILLITMTIYSTLVVSSAPPNPKDDIRPTGIGGRVAVNGSSMMISPAKLASPAASSSAAILGNSRSNDNINHNDGGPVTVPGGVHTTLPGDNATTSNAMNATPSAIPTPSTTPARAAQTPTDLTTTGTGTGTGDNTEKKQCPSNTSRQCCLSLQEVTQDFTNPLSTLIGTLGGIQVGSILGLSCTAMLPSSPDSYCSDTVSCCLKGGDLAGPSTLTIGCSS